MTRRQFRLLGQILYVLSGLAGTLVLLGWLLNIPELTTLFPDMPSMKPRTALSFLLVSVSFFTISLLEGKSHFRHPLLLAPPGFVPLLPVFILGVFSLIQNKARDPYFGFPEQINSFSSLFFSPAMSMSSATAFSFILATLAGGILTGQILLSSESGIWYRILDRFQSSVVYSAILISTLTLLGLIGNRGFIKQLPFFSTMALHTAISFLFLFHGLVLSHSDRGFLKILRRNTYGGLIARRIAPVLIVFPIFFDYAFLSNSSIEFNFFSDQEYKQALLIILPSLIILLYIRWTVDIIHRFDVLRIEREETDKQKNKAITTIFDSMPVSIFVKDPEGRFLFANREFASRQNLTYEEILEKTYEDIYPPDDLEKVKRKDAYVLESGESNESIETTETGGQKRTFQVIKFPIEGFPFQSRMICGISIDITERLELEKSQKRQQILLKGILDNSPDLIIIRNQEGVILYANPAATANYAPWEKDITGKNVFEVFDINRAEAILMHDQLTLENRNPLVLDETYTLADDEICFRTTRFVLKSEPGELADTDETGSICEIATDITEKVLKNKELENLNKNLTSIVAERTWEIQETNKLLREEIDNLAKTKESLRNSEGKFRTIVEQAPDMILLFDTKGKVLDANQFACQLLGYSRKDLLTQVYSTLFATGNGTTPFLSRIDSLLKTTDALYCVKKDGSSFPIEIQGGEIVFSGTLAHAVIVRDVSQRKKNEEEILKKNRALETLLYIASHDLREPLRSMRNFSQLLLSRYADNLDDRAKDYLDRIIKGSTRMNALIEDILQISRAQRRVNIEENLDALDIIQGALDRLESRIKLTGAKIEIHGPFPDLKADPMWCTQALFNLIANALKFTRPNKIPVIDILPFSSDTMTGFIVQDAGPGLPDNMKETAFQLFTRGVGREVEGTGAGLAIVRQVAESHNGISYYEPAEPVGSRFILAFPR